MHWIEVVWSMFAAASLTLGFIHLFAWLRKRDLRYHVAFAAVALSMAIFSLLELDALRARTPAELATSLRWIQVPVAALVLSMVWFIHALLGQGRLWIGVVACVLRVLVLPLNFVLGDNILFLELSGLEVVPWPGGETVVTGHGSPNPAYLIAVASNVLLVIYLLDAWVRAERQPDRDFARRARVVCLTWIASVLFMGGSALLLSIGELHGPLVNSLAFLFVIATTSFELARDVSRAETLAVRLLSTRQDLELAASAGGLALWSWDPDGDRARDPAGSFGVWGIEPGDTTPTTLAGFLDRVHPDDREALRSALESAVAGRGGVELECRMLGSDNEQRWVLMRGGFDPSDRHGPAHMRGVIQDITERREMATQRDKLARLSRITMLGELLASVAHEVNQPLTAILANAQAGQRMLEREPPDLEEVDVILREVVDDAHRAGKVIVGLRELFRDEEPRHAPVDLNAVVGEMPRLLRHFLATHQVHLSLQLAPDLPRVMGDRVQLEQVLLNLVVNACEVMDGQPERRLLGVRTVADAQTVGIRVTDSGRGIPQQDLLRIFDSFVSTRAEGLGLGLSVCRTIVRAHEGRIWAINNEGRGATFCVDLPVLKAGAPLQG
jgi:two-component system sensor kinase FixL